MVQTTIKADNFRKVIRYKRQLLGDIDSRRLILHLHNFRPDFENTTLMDAFKSLTPMRVVLEALPAFDKCLIRSSARFADLVLYVCTGCTKCPVAFKVRVTNGYHVLPCLAFVLRVETLQFLCNCLTFHTGPMASRKF